MRDLSLSFPIPLVLSSAQSQPQGKVALWALPLVFPGFVPLHAVSLCFMPPLKHSWMGAFFCLPVGNHLLIFMIRVLYLHNVTQEQCVFGCCLWPDCSWCLWTKDLLAILKAPWWEVAPATLLVNKGSSWSTFVDCHSLTPWKKGLWQKSEFPCRSQTYCTPFHICLSARPLHPEPSAVPTNGQGFQKHQWMRGGSKWKKPAFASDLGLVSLILSELEPTQNKGVQMDYSYLQTHPASKWQSWGKIPDLPDYRCIQAVFCLPGMWGRREKRREWNAMTPIDP